MKVTAREAALLTLSACETQGAWSDGQLKKLLRESGLDDRDAGLATRLCFGVIQNKGLLDFYLSAFSTLALEKMEEKIRNILRLGAYQLLFLTRIPASAAVNESVVLAKRYSRNPGAARLVNGLLRTLDRRRAALPEPHTGSWAGDASIRYSHPLWLVEEWEGVLGREETEALLAFDNAEAPMAVQVNLLRTNATSLIENLEKEGVEVSRHPWMPDCLLLSGTGDLERLESFRQGLFYVQDPAARLAVLAVGAMPGMRVLDVCAAPGGKSFACAVSMEGRGEILSCDIHPHKKRLLELGAARLGLEGIMTPIVQDGKAFRADWQGRYDLVVCDVPCSGLGVIRKKPDVREKDPGALEGLPAVQSAILENSARYVRPGGVLLYSTCTLRRGENEGIIEAFAERQKDFTLESFELPQPIQGGEEGWLTLWPHRWGTDGFFFAKLRRRA